MKSESAGRDELLDRALAEYVSTEPRPGLEQRVLAQARGASASRRNVFGALSFRLGVASVLMIAVSGFWMWERSAPRNPEKEILVATNKTAVVRSAALVQAAVVQVVYREQRKPLTRRIHRELPKQDVFPAPSPLSDEERALLAFAKHPPKDIPPELLQLGGPIQPIEVAAIDIKPLEPITPAKEN